MHVCNADIGTCITRSVDWNFGCNIGTTDGGSIQQSRPQHCSFADSRTRKQRCGGFTDEIKCRPCTTRKVRCSFQDEVKDLRYNPYLQARPSRSSSMNSDNRPPDTLSARPSSATLLPTLAEFGEGIQPQPPGFSAGDLNITVTDDALPREIDSLKSRFVLNFRLQNEHSILTGRLESLIWKGGLSLLQATVENAYTIHDPKQGGSFRLTSVHHHILATNLLSPRVSLWIPDVKFYLGNLY